MRKQIYLESVEFAMLLELAKKSRSKPEEHLSSMIRNQYENIKKK
jgi:hypothetical protein